MRLSKATNTISHLIDALSEAHSVWHFIEVLFLKDMSSNDKHISQLVSEWFCLNFPEYTPNNASAFDNPNIPDNEFWTYFANYLIVSDFASARKMLGAKINMVGGFDTDWADATAMVHLQEENDLHVNPSSIYHVFETALSSAPSQSVSARIDGTYEVWQRRCATWTTPEKMGKYPPITRKIMSLLSGDMEGIAGVCQSWEQMLVACLNYCKGSANIGGNLRGGLGLLTTACSEASRAFPEGPQAASGALVEVALGNLENAIERIEASMPSMWFSAHLCDLLARAGQVKDDVPPKLESGEQPVRMREVYIEKYARSLEEYSGCWRIAADYFAACPTQGQTLLNSMLSRVQFSGPGDPRVEKALFMCKRRQWESTARSICERIGTQCLEHNNAGGAMAWFVRAGLRKRAQYVADEVLERAEREGVNSDGARCLAYVVSSISSFADGQTRETFDYLRVYHEMQECLVKLVTEDEKIDEETMALCGRDFVRAVRSLVGGGGLPRKYWCVVVYEAAQVLDMKSENSRHFSRAALQELLSALELTCGAHASKELMEGLRARLAFDAVTSGTGKDIEMGGVEDAKSAIAHCRNIYVRMTVGKINAS